MNQPEVRYDHYGPVRLLAAAEGFCMVRYPSFRPFVISAQQWDSLSRKPLGDIHEAH